MHPTKIAAPEGAAHEKICQVHDTMPRTIEQAVVQFRAGLEGLRQFITVVGVQCYMGGYSEVQVATPQDLEYLPGPATVTSRSNADYPYKMSKNVMGIEFVTILKEDPNER